MGAEPVSLRLPGVDAPVRLLRHPRATRLTLRVSRATGEPRLTLPPRASLRDARDFLESHRDWLTARMDESPAPVPFAPGVRIPVRGAPLRIEAAAIGRAQVRLDAEAIRLPAPVAPRLRAWLKEQARADLSAACARHAQALGVRYSGIALKDTRSGWGSCTADGALSFSWRLILAPPAVLDYVAAHEVCHLIEMNHSDRFWALVARLRPDYQRPRDWLRANGADLHRYGREA